MSTYYNVETFERRDIPDELYAVWLLGEEGAPNPKAALYQPAPARPAFNNATQYLRWGDGVWEILDYNAEELAERQLKKWPSAFEFFNAFTTTELNSLLSSTNASIRVRRFMLSIYDKPIRSDWPRIQDFLDDLVTVGIISSQRKAAIIAP